jgi:Holliday junction resolvase RusA-like endonuclease
LALKKAKEINFGDPWEGPVEMSVSFYFKKPEYLTKAIKGHTKKPDLDNLLKSIKDSLNKIIYKDDSQIIRLNASKNYLLGKNARPFVNIKIECIDHDSIVPIHDHGGPHI